MRRLILPLATVTCLLTASAAAGHDLGGAIGDSLANAPAIPETKAGKLAAKGRLDRARVENNPTLRIVMDAGFDLGADLSLNATEQDVVFMRQPVNRISTIAATCTG